MPRKRNTENDLVVSSSGAAPQRRRTTATNRPKHSATTAEPTETSASETQVAPKAAAAAAGHIPSHEEIAERAHSYWVARGCQGGSPEEDWRRAEQELRAETATLAN